MQLRPEKPLTDLHPDYQSPSHPCAKGGCGLVQHYSGATMIWRYGDEPGFYRGRDGCLVPMPQVKHMVPGLAEELEARAHEEDKEKVAREVERLLAGGTSKVIEERGEYALVSVLGGGLVHITRNGVNIHGTALPEKMARSIFDSLAPAPVDLAPAPVLDAVRAAAISG